MAWTAPRTWVAGDVLTAAQLNEQLKANSLILITPLDVLGNLSPDIETSSVTSNQNNLAITVTTGTLVFTGASAIDITGIVAPATAGKLLSIVNRGSGTHTLKDQVTSTAANRFDLGDDVALATDDSIVLVYENSRWRAWCKPPSGASPFTGYAVTLADVANTTSETTFASATIGDMADGDIIIMEGMCEFGNDSGSNATANFALDWNGTSIDLAAAGYNLTLYDVGEDTSGYKVIKILCARIGANLVVQPSAKGAARIGIWGAYGWPQDYILNSATTNGLSSIAPDFASGTVALKTTMSAAHATLFVKGKAIRFTKHNIQS